MSRYFRVKQATMEDQVTIFMNFMYLTKNDTDMKEKSIISFKDNRAPLFALPLLKGKFMVYAAILLLLTLFSNSSCKKKANEPSTKVYEVSYQKSVMTKEGYEVFFTDISDQRCLQSNCATCLPNVAFTRIMIRHNNNSTSKNFNFPGCYVNDATEQPITLDINDNNIQLKIEVLKITPLDNSSEKKLFFKIF